ncbi:MAG: iron ABC transporter permease [Desulfurococcales archaeon]|nr:iron ABC transporter permease [Desulfurococcales archaeon]
MRGKQSRYGASYWWALLPLVVLPFLALLSLSVGAYKPLGLNTLLHYVFGLSKPTPLERSIIRLRLTRTLAGIVAGSALAYAGSSLQYVFRNPLADPYIFGIASGASFAITLALFLGASDPTTLYLAALAGSTVTLAIVALGGLLGGGSAFSYIVSGVAIGYLMWAASTIILIALGPRAHYSLSWLFGTLAYVNNGELKVSSLMMLAVTATAIAMGKRYSKLLLGRDVAAVYGAPYRRLLAELVLLSGVATASATALTGPIGFVGLVAPWISRVTVGSLYSRFTLVGMMWGSILVLASDVAARMMSGYVEMPLTAIMAFVGVPVIIYIMYESRGGAPWG